MKRTLSYFLTFFVGFITALVLAFFLAKVSSQVWQSEVRAKLLWDFQKSGIEAAKRSDWPAVAYEIKASSAVSSFEVREWDLMFPAYGWSVISLAPKKEDGFNLVNDSIVAYSLQQQGKQADALEAYARLQKKYPSKDRKFFEDVAKATLSSGTQPKIP